MPTSRSTSGRGVSAMDRRPASLSRPSSGTLWKLGWRTFTRHLWQSVLMVVGIALGVAVVIAVDLANVSASRAFDLSVDAVAGRATHQIVGGPQGLEEDLYTKLKRSGIVREAAPVIAAYATSPDLGGRPIQVLGVDPFADAPFRSYFSAGEEVSLGQLTAFLTEPGGVLVGADVAERYGLTAGDTLELDVAGRRRTATIVGLLDPADELSRRALEGLIRS